MISRRAWLLIGVVAIAIAGSVVLGWDFLRGTLGLAPRTIGYLAPLLGIVVVVTVLWWKTLRDWARKPGAGDRLP